MQQFSRRHGRAIDTILSEDMTTLTKYPWPGNIRELQNVIERAVILTSGPILKVAGGDLRAPATPVSPAVSQVIASRDMRTVLGETERQEIISALERANWVVAGPQGAAALLNMKRSTLQSRMQKLGIRISRSGAAS